MGPEVTEGVLISKRALTGRVNAAPSALLWVSRDSLKADKTKTLEIFKLMQLNIREKGLWSPSIFTEVQERAK